MPRPRDLQPELMDDPDLAPAPHRAALRGLARLNRLSGAAHILAPSLRAEAAGLDRPLRVLDVATGSGDLPVSLARWAASRGIRLELVGVDVSKVALDTARERAAAAGVPLELHRLDAVSDPLPEADAAVCSLFLHHLTEREAGRVLGAMRRAARRVVLVSDLRRCAWGEALARVVPRLTTRSPIVHTDAVLSVRAAFTAGELGSLAEAAGMAGATLRPRFPARMLLEWRAQEATPS